MPGAALKSVILAFVVFAAFEIDLIITAFSPESLTLQSGKSNYPTVWARFTHIIEITRFLSLIALYSILGVFVNTFIRFF